MMLKYFYRHISKSEKFVLPASRIAKCGFVLATAILFQQPITSFAQTTDSNALTTARAIGTVSRAKKIFYEPSYDLSKLPKYSPKYQVSGQIIQWGNNYVQDSGLMGTWQKEFTKVHPGVSFDDHLFSSAVAIPGLIAGNADIAYMGRQAIWDELKGVERAATKGARADDGSYELIEIVMATGSYNVRGWTFALGIFVHEDNPLTKLTMKQLDGIFGSERDGGWKGLTWDTSVARNVDENIRNWGQLGLTGEWKHKPISLYGYNMKYHFNDEIDKKVLSGSGRWNEQMKAYSNVAGLKADGSLTAGGELLMNALSNDKFGIAYTGIPFDTKQTRPIALMGDTNEYVSLTIDNVQNRTYPLIRNVYLYVRKQKGRPLDFKTREFVSYILSRDGQMALQRDGKYLPLTPDVAAEQLAKLY